MLTLFFLFHRHALRQILRFVDIASSLLRDIISEDLERNDEISGVISSIHSGM